MLNQLRNYRFYIVLGMDLLLICCALLGAYLIRFDFVLKPAHYQQILILLPMMILVKIPFLVYFRAYQGMYRYTSLDDMWKLLKAVSVSTLTVILLILIIYRFQGYSRAVFLIDAGLTFLFLGGFRLMIRMAYQRMAARTSKESAPINLLSSDKDVPTLIVGAGDTGEKILREIRANQRLNYRVMGFVDDDPNKQKLRIHNVPVLGTVEEIPVLTKRYGVEQVLIAAPSASGQQIRRIIDMSKKAGVQFKTLPGLDELIEGRVSIKALRDVNFHDLLRREPVRLDIPEISQLLTGKRVLITGAGGSIGSELCRQVARFQPEALILLDSSEPSLYNVEMEMKHRMGYLKYCTILGQIQDEMLVGNLMNQHQPHVVLHAAAYKHVPMLEINPWQAVTNNVLGCKVMMEQAVKHGVSHFVLISTDKAVRPTNVMGASKRICELLTCAYMGNGTRLMNVRFGNVVGSAGSVVPLFRDQISRGGPVTVTHPEVTRYFMTISEASQLILQAGTLGTGGETFILDMGTPIKIADLARDLIRLSGKEPDQDIEIQYTGLRPGEKLYEELITEGEGIVETEHEKILVIRSCECWNTYNNQGDYRQWLFGQIEELEALARKYDSQAIRKKMKEIVPEFEAQDCECVLSSQSSVLNIAKGGTGV